VSSPTPRDLKSANPVLVETIVRAGAGAGKTRALVQRVSSLYEHFQNSEQRSPRLVVCTFTRKATQELRERLIRNALQSQSAGFLEFVQNSTQLHISTIHGVLSMFLRQAAHHIGLNPSFEIVSSEKSGALFRRTIRASMRDNVDFEGLLDTYSMTQIVSYCREYFDLRLMGQDVVIPTEAGCERLFTARMEALGRTVQTLIEDIDSVAAGEAKWTKYTAGLAELLPKLKFETWTKLSVEEREDLSFPRRPNRPSATASKPSPVGEDLYARLDDAIEGLAQLQKPTWDPQFWKVVEASHSALNRMAASMYEVIFRTKLAEGLIDYADLESFSLYVVKNHPQLAQLFSEEWDQWLVDEFQDTSPSQVALIEALKGKSPAFYVGDPQQSIYLFRGAQVGVFSSKEQQIVEQQGIHTELLRNYRSQPELLSFMNWTFSNSGPPFKSMVPREEKGEEEAAAAAAATPCARLHLLADDEQQSRELANCVFELMDQGVGLNEICILARANSQLNKLSRDLRKAGIPCLVHASGGFARRREVLDGLSIAMFVLNPFDDLNLVRLLRSPGYHVPDWELMLLGKTKGAVWDKLKTLSASVSSLTTCPAIVEVFGRLQKVLERSSQIGFYHTVETEILRSGLIDSSYQEDSTGQREANIWKLLSMLRKADLKEGETPMALVDRLLFEEEGLVEADAAAALAPDRLNLMTVHLSKGLEFDHVLLPYANKAPQLTRHRDLLVANTDDGRSELLVATWNPVTQGATLPPSARAAIEDLNQREQSESERLLYVALTRAKRSVRVFGVGKVVSGSWMDRPHWTQPLESIQEDAETTFEIPSSPAFGVHVLKRARPLLERKFFADEARVIRPPWSILPASENAAPLETKKLGSIPDFVSRLRAGDRGNRFHELMQACRYQSFEAAVQLAAERFPDDINRAQQALRYLQQQTDFPWGQLMQTGFSEYGFAFEAEGKLQNRRIDLWGVVDEKIWMIDYKTGPSSQAEIAFEQLQAYAQRLAPILNSRGLGNLPLTLVATFPFERVSLLQSYSAAPPPKGVRTSSANIT
jgi:ATP-dependent helicase/nuclease subunit A